MAVPGHRPGMHAGGELVDGPLAADQIKALIRLQEPIT